MGIQHVWTRHSAGGRRLGLSTDAQLQTVDLLAPVEAPPVQRKRVALSDFEALWKSDTGSGA
jgi:hypothetical protein